MCCAKQAQKRTYTNDERRNNRQGRHVAAQAARVAPEKAPSKKGASRKNVAAKGREVAKGGKAKAAKKSTGKKAAKPARKAVSPRAESKGAKILEMIARAKGATLAEIMKATAWHAHSVRGFISAASKKHGVKIESAKGDAGERTYKIAK